VSRVLTISLPDGRTLEAVDEGDPDGTMLIFHHGSPGAAVAFEPFDRAAAERGIRLVTLSRAGFADSSRLEGRSLACAALLPERVRAAATIAGVAPYDAEGLTWTDGMGEDNQIEYPLAARDPDELLRWMQPQVEALAVVEPDEIVSELRTLLSEVDEAEVTGALGELLAASFHRAFANGVWGWYDDDLAFVRPWGFELASIRVPVSVWQGRQDLMVPFAHGEWLVAHVPTARARLRPEHGHLSLAVGSMGEILDDLLEAAATIGP
jgi:pimeloyl-ACP methyl ester carboxylesterase